MNDIRADEPATTNTDDPIGEGATKGTDETVAVNVSVSGAPKDGVLTAILGQWAAFRMILRGYPLEAFQLSGRIPRFWLVSFLMAALVFGLSAATAVTRTVSAANTAVAGLFSTFGAHRSSYVSLSPGQWIGIVLVGMLFAGAAFILRAATLKWLFAVRRRPQSYSVGANILAVAYSGHLAVYVAAFVLMFVPGAVFGSVVTVVAAALLALLNFAAELLIYVGVNRVTTFEKSVLVPHVLFSALWLVLVAVVYATLFAIFAESLLGS
ncbi:hypothetical protein VUN82_06225 [Micrococcaceae bacterium Sec5.1]